MISKIQNKEGRLKSTKNNWLTKVNPTSDELRSLVATFICNIGSEYISDVSDVMLRGTDAQKDGLAYIFEHHEMPPVS